MALPVVIFVLLRLADSEYSPDPNLLLIVLPILILINLLFFPKERVSIQLKKGEFFITKRPRYGSSQLLELNLKKGVVKDLEVKNGKSLFRGKILINYKHKNELKEVVISLKNFSTKNRNELLKNIASEI